MMRPNGSNNTIVFLLMCVQLIQAVLGRFPSYVQTLPREVPPPQSPLPDRLFQLPSSPRYTTFHPRKKNLKTRNLLKRLGKAFDPEWMSIEQPVHLHEVLMVDAKLVSEARHVNFSLSDSAAGRLPNISSSMLAAFQEWLIQRGSCPVHYTWEDLGINFWPRWLKRGFCVDEGSCSWPPGMHCLPAESRRIRLLGWQCVPRGRKFNKKAQYKHKNKDPESNATENWSKKLKHKQRRMRYGMKCKWRKIQYPVTDECFCSC